ncbi:Breast carcinoma-amplified sequence 1 like protein [Myotis brandtii]|uniref:Breast carcinoma-amplified sequence 1 like protein n=1 Tax=Myotis brandtii TaxID=109478 RepID=S7MLV2_MYOBR|nr:Breast carcinoma-amplified sequence 1 like protein [Myotis brandtii]
MYVPFLAESHRAGGQDRTAVITQQARLSCAQEVPDEDSTGSWHMRSQQAPDEEAKGKEPAQLTAGTGPNQLQTRRPAPEQLQVTPGTEDTPSRHSTGTMGNQMSVHQRAEEQENDSETDTHEVASKRDCVHNGTPVMVSTYTVQLYDEVDLGISIQEDSAAASSPKTVETSAVAGGAAPSKPKDAGFFNKLFKLDKGQEQAPAVSHQEAQCAAREDQAFDIPVCPGPAHDVPAERDIVEGQDKGQEVTPVSCSLPRDPEELEIAKEDPQTTAITEDNNPIMSFFKTLVSPNKAETKKDLEDTACKAESVCDGQAGQKTPEIPAKGTKKKHLDSPRLGLAFRRFFRHKGAEKSPATSADLKSDKATFVPQETQGAAKNPTPTETAKEGAKQKGGPSPLPLGKLFWKKVPSPISNTVSDNSQDSQGTETRHKLSSSQPAGRQRGLKN